MCTRKVSYMYNSQIGSFNYPRDHPMKPKRIKMAHSLIINYSLYSKIDMYSSRRATKNQMLKFHNQQYITYLEKYVTAKKQKIKCIPQIQENPDCPKWEGLYNFCQLSAGASLDCADLIISGKSTLAINWSGGLHHAKSNQASGFCYVNDIVLCILQLLKFYQRVLYLDIDVHHADGVQQAFYLTNRVLTVSFHQFGTDFFPGTGDINQIGQDQGQNYSLNIPLKAGITDQQYFQLFKSIMQQTVPRYNPQVIVIQSGADSLSKDKLGHLNLSIQGHGNCIKHMMKYNIPIILLGGGGYTIQNVARCWTYQTGIAVGQQIKQPIPINDNYYNMYGPDYLLNFPIDTSLKNMNNQTILQQLRINVLQNVKKIEIGPSINKHEIPKIVEIYDQKIMLIEKENV